MFIIEVNIKLLISGKFHFIAYKIETCCKIRKYLCQNDEKLRIQYLFHNCFSMPPATDSYLEIFMVIKAFDN